MNNRGEMNVSFLTYKMSSRDLWYFLYSSTDKQFRDLHLKEVLLEYYNSFSKYLALEEVHITFEEFLREMDSVRVAFGLGFGIGILFIALTPEPLGGDPSHWLFTSKLIFFFRHFEYFGR